MTCQMNIQIKFNAVQNLRFQVWSFHEIWYSHLQEQRVDQYTSRSPEANLHSHHTHAHA